MDTEGKQELMRQHAFVDALHLSLAALFRAREEHSDPDKLINAVKEKLEYLIMNAGKRCAESWREDYEMLV